jgi:hypothetical protein
LDVHRVDVDVHRVDVDVHRVDVDVHRVDVDDRRAWTPDDGVLELLGEEGDGETWLARFPAPLVASLAGLAGDERARVIGEWSATEEMASPPDEVAPIVGCLVELARTALETGRGLYLWGSL